MAFVKKMKEGDKTPALYTMYGKKYDFTDLQRRADAGLAEYLSTLKRGLKDAALFREAYANLMNGIKDGSITFENGQYSDALGRYDNTSEGKVIKNLNKDHYGLIAHYIYGKLQETPEYTEPADPSKVAWNGNSSVGKVFLHNLYNSDNGNILDFIDRDPIDPKTNKRGTATRTADILKSLLYTRANLDSRISGLSDADRTATLAYLDDAIKAVQDGRLDSLDYLPLSRALGNVDFRSMFVTTGNPTPEPTGTPTGTPTRTPAGVPTGTPAGTPTTGTPVAQTPLFGGVYSLDFPERYRGATLNSLASYLNTLDNLALYSLLNEAISNSNYQLGSNAGVKALYPDQTINFSRQFAINAILGTMLRKGILKAEAGGYYSVPNTSIWYNPTNRSISKFVTFSKKGGIIKASGGTNTNIFFSEGDDFGYNTYLNGIFGNLKVLDWMKSNYSGSDATSNYAQYVMNNVNGRHAAGINDYDNSKTYTASDNDAVSKFNTGYLNGGNTLNYVLFGNSSDEYNGVTGADGKTQRTGVAYSLGNFNRPATALKTGDSYNTKDPTKSYIDNILGAQTYSRVASLTDSNLKTGGFGAWGDYWKGLGNTGAYYYTAEGDTSGRGQWIPVNEANLTEALRKTYQAFNTPPAATATEGTPGGASGDKGGGDSSTKVDPRTGKPVGGISTTNKVLNTAKNYLPDALEAGNFVGSIIANHNIAKALRERGLSLHNPLEEFTAITGKKDEMDFRSQQAANIRTAAGRAFTSDASLQANREYDGNRQATGVEHLGFLADANEIRRTTDEAVKHRFASKKSRIDTGNYNSDQQAEYKNAMAEIKAAEIQHNYQSASNYVNGIISRQRASLAELKQKQEEDELRYKAFQLDNALKAADREYTEGIRRPLATFQAQLAAWRADPANTGKSALDAPGYDNYAKFLADMDAYREAKKSLAYALTFGYLYDNPDLNNTVAKIQAKYGWLKLGGKLIPRKHF